MKNIFYILFLCISTSPYAMANLSSACFDEKAELQIIFKDCFERAEQGDTRAQYNLGLKYYNGEGTTRNYKEGIKWFKKAAEQGNANAQYNLGVLYDTGGVVTTNYKEAFKWYKKAAEQGYADAQYNLGQFYRAGKEITQNYTQT